MIDEKELTYIEKNRWYITPSKLKYFIQFWPEAYKKKYIDEISTGDEDKRYFLIWTAFDDLCSYGSKKFFEKYCIKEKLLKSDLIEKLTNEWIEFDKKALVWDLEKLYYWNKIMLSASEWETILWMYKEAGRQPLVDMWWWYESQKEITCEYKSLKLKWTLDRFSADKKLIRDWKTTASVDYFEYNMDTKLWYVLSMAFYYLLAKTKYNISCDVILDVLGKKSPFVYYWYKLTKDQLFEQIRNKIIPWLDALIECIETDTRESVYPIKVETEWKFWDIIIHEKWEQISRTKLIQSWYYSSLDWAIQDDFITSIVR